MRVNTESSRVPAAAREPCLHPEAHREGVEMGPQASLTAAYGYRFKELFSGV